MREKWTETEVQGRGRRYWFRETSHAVAFWRHRTRRGYRAVYDGDGSKTVWVPFAKKLNDHTRMQHAGIDTSDLD